MTTLYDRLGGQGAIDAFVPLFYEKVLADDRISPFFRGVDIDKQSAACNDGVEPRCLGHRTDQRLNYCKGHTNAKGKRPPHPRRQRRQM